MSDFLALIQDMFARPGMVGVLLAGLLFWVRFAKRPWTGAMLAAAAYGSIWELAQIIHEAPGLSYVKEPVFVGEAITLNLVVRRTRLGAGCTFLNRTAIFTDETNIASAARRSGLRGRSAMPKRRSAWLLRCRRRSSRAA